MSIYDGIKTEKRRSGTESSVEKGRIEYLKKRDIAPLPRTINPKRRKLCKRNFILFVKTYFSARCPDFDDNRKKLAKLLETSVLKNEQIVVGLPRGSGKSTLSRLLTIWAVAY